MASTQTCGDTTNNSFTDSFLSNTSLYYGVYTPNDNKDNSTSANVFQDKVEALKLARKNKKARFKAFQYYHEAADFALNGSEYLNPDTNLDGLLFPKKTESSQTIGEKGSPFKGPKPQELIELRKAIEAGNYKFVRDTIWQNPRYLVSNGDTPSILQEGARHNALHVAAKAKDAAITDLILTTISDVSFVQLLYGDDNQENAEDRAKMLLDLYLNTPNKGLNETPLHFASKHGAVEVVEILVSYPQCDKLLKNKYQKTAAQIICERSDDTSAGTMKKIDRLLQDTFYVPILRAEDNSMAPTIGTPFSPALPPVFSKDPLSPRLEIHAFAGPMDEEGAQEFRKVWKTPPRVMKLFPSNKTQKDDLRNLTSLRYKDPEKGLERIGNILAKKMDVCWQEFWPFLDSFVDIGSEDGINKLETYLAGRFSAMQPVADKSTKNWSPSPIVNKSEISTITNLCNLLQACRLNDSDKSKSDYDGDKDTNNKTSAMDQLLHIERACQVFAYRISNDLQCIFSEFNNLTSVLETELKQFEALVISFMDDVCNNDIDSINFQKVHSRLGALIGQRLAKNIADGTLRCFCEKIENFLDALTKSVDYFSSDDEGINHLEQRKPTMYRKQLFCLINFTLIVLNQNVGIVKEAVEECDYAKDWEEAKECACIYHVKKTKKYNSLSRNNSLKLNNKYVIKNDGDMISRKLNFDEEDGLALGKHDNKENHNSLNGNQGTDSSDNEDDEEFYTPPASPSLLVDSDSEDEFNDTELPKIEIYIEGDSPTKTDYAVFNALLQSDYIISHKKHPHVYRWRHNISLFTEKERESWPNPQQVYDDKCPNATKSYSDGLLWSSPNLNNTKQSKLLNRFGCSETVPASTPLKSWLRITGANSPRAVKSYHVNV